MNSLQELLQQREALDAQIRQARQEQTAEAIAKIKSLIAEFELTEADVFGGRRKAVHTGSKVAPKYSNPETGETWTGRGKPPKWIQGKNRDDFLIQ
ncbi:H-NS family nucleoid-associated regulatory protein [Brachymonas sp. M4Q-1]|uniref:H-NS histone family protein n=1 Tax=Brachymonas sp. M4Q-1 TaxID=3416906 RepID=UPI003CFA031A